MPDWFERLTHACTHAGDRPVRWHDPQTNCELLLLPNAGRIIACKMDGAEGNAFYHHASLEDASHAGQTLAGGGGLGGDRLWIAPESAFMWRDLAGMRHELAKHARTPPAMDPAAWQIVRQTPRMLELQTAMKLQDHRSDQPLELSLRVKRQFEWLPALKGLPEELNVMSFAIENEVTLIEGGPDAQAGAWDLLQLPAGGTLICPTMRPPRDEDVRSYYEPLDAHVKLTGEAVLFRVDAKRRVKLGLWPGVTAGRMAYHRPSQDASGRSTLIVRTFQPCVGMDYIDLPVDDVLAGARTGGDALQAYNHNTQDMPFGEMEYHDPAVCLGDAPMTRRGRCITHVLAGPDAQIKQSGEALLGAPIVSF